MTCTRLISLVILFSLTACSTSPKHIVISPELFGYTKSIYSDKAIQLNVIDQRPGNQVVQIINGDDPAKLFSSQDSLSNIVTQAISPALRKQGLTLNNNANTRVDIFINTALINVTQNFVDYHVNNSITLTVNIKKNGTSTSKTFSSRGKSHGPLVADMAVLERDFNHQLAALLIKITNSFEIQHSINNDTTL